MTTELMERQTLVTLAECYTKAAPLAAKGLKMLTEAQEIMKKGLGSHYDSLFPYNELRCYNLDERNLEESQTQIRENFWRYTLEQTGIRELMAPTDRERMEKMFTDHTTPQFTLENLISTLQGLAENQGEIFNQAVVECFEKLRPHDFRPTHKTNSSWKINNKIIVEYVVDHWNGTFSFNYHKEQLFFELDKVFHCLDGKGLPKRPGNATTAIKDAMQKKEQEAETEYFRMKWFKVGTMHVWFKRPDLVKDFNQIGAAGSVEIPANQ